MSTLIKIDLQQVLDSKLGAKSRFVPKWLVNHLAKIIRQEQLNKLLEENYPAEGAEFCNGVMKSLDIKFDIRNVKNLPESPRQIFVSNHPLGGLDGISMIAWMSRQYPGTNVRFVVNDLLMAVTPLKNCFLPINKHGRQDRNYDIALDEALAGSDPVVIYPAGLVSRKDNKGIIADLKWQKMFVAKALKHQRDIVPLHFDGQNSESFYNIARRRKKLGLKFNIEMIYLPREMFRSTGATFTISCGKPILYTSLKSLGSSYDEIAQAIREETYKLKPKSNK